MPFIRTAVFRQPNFKAVASAAAFLFIVTLDYRKIPPARGGTILI